jgi:hypothetical protein
VSLRPPPDLAVALGDDGDTELFAERLRDGRIVIGTRERTTDGWKPHGLHVLNRAAFLALAGWLAEPVEEAWLDTVRERQDQQLRTAHDLFGTEADAAERLASEMLRHLPPALLRRALILLVNSIGPEARSRLVQRLNRTADVSEEGQLRRDLAETDEALGYAVAAASLLDAIGRGRTGDV